MARKILDPVQKKRRRRRRILISLVLLALVLLIPPYFVGKQVEKGILTFESRFAGNPNLVVKVKELDRGWFSTRSVIDVRYNRHTRNGEMTLLETSLHNKTNHGLFYLSPLIQNQEPRLPGAVLSQLSESTAFEAAMSSGFRPKLLLSSLNDTGKVRLLGGEHEVHTQDISGFVEASTTGSQFTVNADVKSLKIGDKEAPMVEIANLNTDAEVVKPRLVEQAFEPTMIDMKLSLDKISANAAIFGKLVIKDLALNVQASKDDSFVRDITFTTGLLMTSFTQEPYCNPGCSDIEISLRIEGLDAEGAHMVDTQISNIIADMREIGSSTQLAQIFASEPTITIRGIKASAFRGKLDVKGELKLFKTESPAISMDQLESHLDGNLNLYFDAAMIKGFEMAKLSWLEKRRKGKRILREVDAMLAEYTWLIRDVEKDRYSASLVFKDRAMQTNPGQ